MSALKALKEQGYECIFWQPLMVTLAFIKKEMVFLELKRRQKEIYYWKDQKSEADFIVKEGIKVTQIYRCTII